MARHYTHVGELAASNAVAALPALIGDAKPAQVKLDADTLLAKLHAIANSMHAKNWREKRAKLLAL